VAVPNKVPKLTFADLPVDFNQHYSNLVDRVNSLLGYNGTVEIGNHLSLNGKRIINVGEAVGPADAVSQALAESKYSAAALQPQIAPGGKFSIVGYRQLNSGTQREQQSSWLNDLMSSVPNANAVYPTITNGIGDVMVALPSTRFTFADGSNVILEARTDVLSKPAQYAITSIACVGNVVSVVCAPSGLAAGQVATIAGVAPSTFNGSFVLTSSTGGGANLEYQDDLGTVTGAGGFVQVNGVYYYAVRKRSTVITLLGPYPSDTAQNRLNANFDSFQIVAVVTVTNSGASLTDTGGGGTPIIGSPTAGAFF
jgi:hypothetical protein